MLQSLSMDHHPYALVFSPDGQDLIVGCIDEKTVKVFTLSARGKGRGGPSQPQGLAEGDSAVVGSGTGLALPFPCCELTMILGYGGQEVKDVLLSEDSEAPPLLLRAKVSGPTLPIRLLPQAPSSSAEERERQRVERETRRKEEEEEEMRKMMGQ